MLLLQTAELNLGQRSEIIINKRETRGHNTIKIDVRMHPMHPRDQR